eukprot:7815350-Alexandrium_andersonii.AAC.1
MKCRITDSRIADERIADGCSVAWDPPEMRLQSARRPVSSSASDSAHKMEPDPPVEALSGGI